jgi:ABC-type transport system substrate-binding protein
VLYLDTVARGPGDKAAFDWYRRQFEKLTIQLEIRTTDWNRFQEKIRKGATQIFRLGWNADYPDPENFLFLLYGPQSRRRTRARTPATIPMPEYDALFERMKNMPNSPERQKIIDRMVEIARRDAAWIWGSHARSTACAMTGSPTTSRTTWRATTQVPEGRHREARAHARAVEPADPLADRPDSSGADCSAVPGSGELPSRERMAARPA